MAKKPTSKPKPKSKSTSKLGRGLSALMADIAVPLEPMPAKNPEISSEKNPLKSTATNAKTTKPKTPSMLSAFSKINTPSSENPKAAKHSSHAEPTAPIQANTIAHSDFPTLIIDQIERNPDQPRKVFNKEKLAELTTSIHDNGVLQPILVRPLPKRFVQAGEDNKTRYQIVAGERRWLAALMAGLLTIPAMVRDLSDQEVLEIGVIENVQRADLNPIEEAQAYSELITQFNRKQSEIAAAIGKSRPYVANALRLLNLPKIAQQYLLDGKISAGHARAILAASDPQALTEAVVRDGLSVRDTEKLARVLGKEVHPAKFQPSSSDANIVALEKELSDVLGMKVRINHKIPGGSVSIKYKSMEHLDDIIRRLSKV